MDATNVNKSTFSLSVAEEMIEYIKKNKIYSYNEFLNYCMENNEMWFKKLIDNPSFKNYF